MDWRPPGWTYFPKEGLEDWTEKVFYALFEVAILALPALLVTSATGPDVIGQSFGASVSLLALVLGIATVRSEYDPIGIEWPGFSPASVLARTLWYNGAIGLAGFGGRAIDLLVFERLGTVGFAVAVSVVAVATLPRFAAACRRLLSWWTWGRPFP
jgi:hypothetical protein